MHQNTHEKLITKMHIKIKGFLEVLQNFLPNLYNQIGTILNSALSSEDRRKGVSEGCDTLFNSIILFLDDFLV